MAREVFTESQKVSFTDGEVYKKHWTPFSKSCTQGYSTTRLLLRQLTMAREVITESQKVSFTDVPLLIINPHLQSSIGIHDDRPTDQPLSIANHQQS
jgi:hypothetical protein